LLCSWSGLSRAVPLPGNEKCSGDIVSGNLAGGFNCGIYFAKAKVNAFALLLKTDGSRAGGVILQKCDCGIS
jgi:hypothetical protein